VVAYRQESREPGNNELLRDEGVSEAVRTMVEEHKAKH
jgi:hypothetical protein